MSIKIVTCLLLAARIRLKWANENASEALQVGNIEKYSELYQLNRELEQLVTAIVGKLLNLQDLLDQQFTPEFIIYLYQPMLDELRQLYNLFKKAFDHFQKLYYEINQQ